MQYLLDLAYRNEKPLDLTKIARRRNDATSTGPGYLFLLGAQRQIGIDPRLGQLNACRDDTRQVRTRQPLGDG